MVLNCLKYLQCHDFLRFSIPEAILDRLEPYTFQLKLLRKICILSSVTLSCQLILSRIVYLILLLAYIDINYYNDPTRLNRFVSTRSIGIRKEKQVRQVCNRSEKIFCRKRNINTSFYRFLLIILL